MRTYYQVYRDGYWHTSTLDKAEAFRLAETLRTKGHSVDVRVEGLSIVARPITNGCTTRAYY